VCFQDLPTRVHGSICRPEMCFYYSLMALSRRRIQRERNISVQRLARIVSSHLQQTPSELIDTIYASVIEFQGTSVLADDLTLVVLKVL